MVEDGARNLVLVSRSGLRSTHVEAEVAKVQSASGIVMKVVKCDVSKLDSVRELLASSRPACRR